MEDIVAVEDIVLADIFFYDFDYVHGYMIGELVRMSVKKLQYCTANTL